MQLAKAKAEGNDEVSKEEAASREELLSLQAALDNAKKGKADSAALAVLQKAVDEKRAKHHSGKSIVAQVKNIEHTLADLQAKAERHAKRTVELRKKAEEAQQALEEQLQAEQAVAERLAKATNEAEQLRARAVEAAELKDDADPLKAVLAQMREWLATQPLETIASFRSHASKNAGADGRNDAADKSNDGISAMDVLEDDFPPALLGDDNAELVRNIREQLVKRGPAAIQQAMGEYGAKRAKRG